MKAGYSAPTGAAVALVAATAKVVIGVMAPAQFGVDLKKVRIGFDGVVASALPVLVQPCAITFATNPPGTASTSITVVQQYGRTITAGFTAAYNWTTAPTVITPLEDWWIDPNKSTALYDWPLGDTPDSPVSNGFGLQCNAPAAVNYRGALIFERC